MIRVEDNSLASLTGQGRPSGAWAEYPSAGAEAQPATSRVSRLLTTVGT